MVAVFVLVCVLGVTAASAMAGTPRLSGATVGVQSSAPLGTLPLPTTAMTRTTGQWRNDAAFAALRADGSVVTWGRSDCGGDSSSVGASHDGTIDVVCIYASDSAFAALRANGSVVTSGNSGSGGDLTGVSAGLDGTVPVTQIFSTPFAFAALRTDESLVTWGEAASGGDSSSVSASLDGTIDVTGVSSTNFAFAAVRADGSVVTWGDAGSGGNAFAAATDLIDVATITDPGEGQSWTLATAIAGTGAGTITSDPVGISCRTSCTTGVRDETTVTLTATAATGSTFAGWSGACTCTVTPVGRRANSGTATFTAAAGGAQDAVPVPAATRGVFSPAPGVTGGAKWGTVGLSASARATCRDLVRGASIWVSPSPVRPV